MLQMGPRFILSEGIEVTFAFVLLSIVLPFYCYMEAVVGVSISSLVTKSYLGYNHNPRNPLLLHHAAHAYALRTDLRWKQLPLPEPINAHFRLDYAVHRPRSLRE